MTASPFARGTAAADRRLPEASRVGGAVIQVSQLAQSLAFYTGVLGLCVLHASEDEAALGVPPAVEPLVTLKAIPGTRPARRRGAYGLFHFAILLPDRASLGRFVTHLAINRVQVGMSDHLVSEAIYLSDPDGLGIEVYCDRPRSQWTYADGQLEMATEPLDVADLVRAAQSQPWTGAPAGTTMGHMHLHVGDLDQAARFYHEGLGFDVTVWGYPGALFFSAGGYHHHLGTNTWAPGPQAPPDQAQLHEWTLVVPTPEDVVAIASRVAASGSNGDSGGNGRTVVDPWGTRLRITSPARQPESAIR